MWFALVNRPRRCPWRRGPVPLLAASTTLVAALALGLSGCKRAAPASGESAPPEGPRAGSPLALPALPQVPTGPANTTATRSATSSPPRSAAASPPATASSPVAWLSNLDQALARARNRQQLVLLLFSAQDVGGARELRTTGVSDPEVAGLVKDMVCCELNVAVYPELAKEFGVSAVPTVVLLTPDRSVLGSFQGYGSSKRLAGELRKALATFASR